MIHIIRTKTTPQQIQDMLEELKDYIKLAVDVKERIVAGGGEMHADCEEALLADGSQQKDIWGADWLPDKKIVRFQSLINIRPKQGNRSMVIEDMALQGSIERVVRERLELP